MAKKTVNQAEKPAKKPMSKESKILLLVLLIAVAIVVGWRTWKNTSAEKSAAELAAALEAAILQSDGSGEAVVVDSDGNRCVALLELLPLEVKLPVLEKGTEDNLDTAPGVFAGAVGEPGLLIGGSSYSGHFGMLSELFLGDLIWLTDVNGNVYEYEMVEMVQVKTSDISQISGGDWDLTMFTSDGGSKYLLVRCSLVEN